MEIFYILWTKVAFPIQSQVSTNTSSGEDNKKEEKKP